MIEFSSITVIPTTNIERFERLIYQSSTFFTDFLLLIYSIQRASLRNTFSFTTHNCLIAINAEMLSQCWSTKTLLSTEPTPPMKFRSWNMNTKKLCSKLFEINGTKYGLENPPLNFTISENPRRQSQDLDSVIQTAHAYLMARSQKKMCIRCENPISAEHLIIEFPTHQRIWTNLDLQSH